MAETGQSASIESREDFDNDKSGQYKYYATELQASIKMLGKWHKTADKIVKRYLGKPANTQTTLETKFNLNLFHSNTQTLGAMLYGTAPKIDVSRRYADPEDDIARVAATTMERLLNLDVQNNGAEIDAVFRAALFDRLVSGLGCARVRYDVQTGEVDGEQQLVSEDAKIEYYYWGDVLWAWSRNFAELRWVAFRNYLTKDEIEQRFNKHAAENIQLKQQTTSSTGDANRDSQTDGAWLKGEIWEVWDKEKRKVCWLSLGYDKALDIQDDPLKLRNFFPIPPFFMANPTTTLYVPTPDFKLAEDLYNEIDKLQERISIITEAVKVVGVYDASNDEIKQMFKQGLDNDLIPVENWALFGEKQGLRGQIDWLPIKDIVDALDKLRDLRSEAIGLLQQVTGMSDIMRGELGSAYEGVGQSQLKAKFGSVRIQALQDTFARFATDLMQIKAEIIARHFSPQTIAQKSNMVYTSDRELLPAAIELIKDPEKAQLRVDIRPESVAMVDYAQLKNERTDYLNALSTFMQSASPLMEADPAAKPFLLQLLQWGLAGFKGASEIEGVIDKAIAATQEAAKQAEQNPKADPAQQAAAMAQQLEQIKQQGELAKIEAKKQADTQLRAQDQQADIQTALEAHRMKLGEVAAQMQSKVAEIRAKMEADIMVERVQTQANIAQNQAQAETEITKDAATAQINLQEEAGKSALKINEIAASSASKIREMEAKPEETSNVEGE